MKSPKTKQKPTRQKRVKSSPRKSKMNDGPVKIRQFLVSRNNSKVLVLDILKLRPAAVVLPKEERGQYIDIVPNYSRGLRNFFFKTAPVVLMVLLLSLNFAGAKRTFAIFNDSNSLLANSFAAGTLDFAANSGGELLFDLKPGESLKKDIIITNNGTLNFQYNVVLEKVSNSDDLCDKIQSSVDLNGSPVYSGGLMNFTSGDIVFTPTEQRWTFNVFLPSESNDLGNKTCQFKFVFNGRQDNLPPGFGFSDTQNVQSNFQIDSDFCAFSGDDDDHQSLHKNNRGKDENNDNENNDGENNGRHCGRHNTNGGGEHEENNESNVNDHIVAAENNTDSTSIVASINEDEPKENKPSDEKVPVSLDETENKDANTSTPETNNSSGLSDDQPTDSPQPAPTENDPT